MSEVQLTVTRRWVDDMTIYQLKRSERHEHEAYYFFELQADSPELLDRLDEYCQKNLTFAPQFGGFEICGDRVIYSVSHCLDYPYYWDSWGISATDSCLRDDLPFLAEAFDKPIASLRYVARVPTRHIISTLRAWALAGGHKDLLKTTAEARAEHKRRREA